MSRPETTFTIDELDVRIALMQRVIDRKLKADKDPHRIGDDLATLLFLKDLRTTRLQEDRQHKRTY